MSEDKLIARRDGPVARIIFNNPVRHNAVSLDMWQTVDSALDDFVADDSLRALVVSGAGGKAFVSGADISKFESERATTEAVAEYNATSARVYEKLFTFPMPTIAKITGYCIGGGMNLAACCDLRFCEDSSRFAIPAAKLGLGYGYGGVQRLSNIIGLSRAMEMFYTARQFSSHEAYEMGLVNKVLPAMLLDTYVDECTRMISENAPMTIATIKAVATEISRSPDQPDRARLDAMVDACFKSNDYVEGRRAFMEKRKPAFTGT